MSNAEFTGIIQPEALWQKVVQAMRRAIVIGELEPGKHLKEPALAQRFGVSRLPIREAIAQLEREGLVRSEPRRGRFVVGVTEQAISDIYECRLLLESCALRRLVACINEEGLATLAALIAQMEEAVSSGQVQTVTSNDLAFHRQLIELSGSRALATAWEPLTPLIETALGIAEATVPDLPTAVGNHRGILQALRERDAEKAVTLLSDHLPGGEKLVLEAVRRGRGLESA